MALFESISKKFSEAHKKDEEKLQTRISRKMSRVPGSMSAQEIASLLQEAEENDEFEEDDDDLIADHEKWETSGLALLHMLGFVIGLSNVWRFPYLCFNHGGGAFLIPYFIFLIFFAYPHMYLELLLGQYTQVGCIAAWRVAPLFKGVGICMTILAVMYCFNAQTVLAWSAFYIFQAMFYNPLPWISCDNGFGNLENGKADENFTLKLTIDYDEARNWHTENCTDFYADSETQDWSRTSSRLPGSEFLRGRVQRTWLSRFADTFENESLANGYDDFGLDPYSLNGHLAFNLDTNIALLISMIVVIGLVMRGIKLNNKFLLLCIVVPYIIMIMLLYRATGLPGSWRGLGFLFYPDFTALADTNVWWKAAEQVYISTGCGLGIHMTIGSHNLPNRSILNASLFTGESRDTIFVVSLNTFTSLLSSSVLFMFLGHIQQATKRKIESFIASGPELVFEVMADMLGVLAKANFYAIMFYVMLFLLGLTTIVCSLINAKTAFYEVLPVSIKYKQKYKFAVFGSLLCLSIFASSVNLTRGGLHNYSFQETFIGSYSVICCSFVFLIGASWFWGLQDIVDACRDMGIGEPGIYLQICWKFISPLICLGILLGLATDPNTHRVIGFDYKYIPISVGLRITGQIMAGGPFCFVLFAAIHTLSRAEAPTFKQKWLLSLTPTRHHKEILSTGTGERARAAHYLYFYATANIHAGRGCCGRGKIAPQPIPEYQVTSAPSSADSNAVPENADSPRADDDKLPKLIVSEGEQIQLTKKKSDQNDKFMKQQEKFETLSSRSAKSPPNVEKPSDNAAKQAEKQEKIEGQKLLDVGTSQQPQNQKRESAPESDQILRNLLGTKETDTRRNSGVSRPPGSRRKSSGGASQRVGACAQQ